MRTNQKCIPKWTDGLRMIRQEYTFPLNSEPTWTRSPKEQSGKIKQNPTSTEQTPVFADMKSGRLAKSSSHGTYPCLGPG